MHHNNICIVGIPEGEECEQGIEDQFKDIMTKNFPNHIKGKDTQAQEAQTVTKNLDPKNPTPKHLMIKMTKLKDGENPKSCKRKAGN